MPSTTISLFRARRKFISTRLARILKSVLATTAIAIALACQPGTTALSVAGAVAYLGSSLPISMSTRPRSCATFSTTSGECDAGKLGLLGGTRLTKRR